MKIEIEDEAIRRIKGFTHLASGEVGGMARVVIRNQTPYVYDLRLLPDQKVTGASIEVDNVNLALFLSTVERPEEFKFLWHSHVNMQTGLSSIDQVCINGFLKTSNFLISCVSSKNGKMFIQFDGIINDLRISQSCTIHIMPETYDDLREELNSHIIDSSYFSGFEGDNFENPHMLQVDGFTCGHFGNSARNLDLFSNRKNIDINVFKMKEDIDDEE